MNSEEKNAELMFVYKKNYSYLRQTLISCLTVKKCIYMSQYIREISRISSSVVLSYFVSSKTMLDYPRCPLQHILANFIRHCSFTAIFKMMDLKIFSIRPSMSIISNLTMAIAISFFKYLT